MQQTAEGNRSADESGELFWVTVSLGKALDVLAKEGGYSTWSRQYFSGANEAPQPHTEERIPLRIMRFDAHGLVPEEDVLKRMKALGLHPADARDLIEFGRSFPEFCRNDAPVIALGSRRGDGSGSCVLYLGGTPETRTIGVSWGCDPWSPNCRFLCRI